MTNSITMDIRTLANQNLPDVPSHRPDPELEAKYEECRLAVQAASQDDARAKGALNEAIGRLYDFVVIDAHGDNDRIASFFAGKNIPVTKAGRENPAILVINALFEGWPKSRRSEAAHALAVARMKGFSGEAVASRLNETGSFRKFLKSLAVDKGARQGNAAADDDQRAEKAILERPSLLEVKGTGLNKLGPFQTGLLHIDTETGDFRVIAMLGDTYDSIMRIIRRLLPDKEVGVRALRRLLNASSYVKPTRNCNRVVSINSTECRTVMLIHCDARSPNITAVFGPLPGFPGDKWINLEHGKYDGVRASSKEIFDAVKELKIILREAGDEVVFEASIIEADETKPVAHFQLAISSPSLTPTTLRLNSGSHFPNPAYITDPDGPVRPLFAGVLHPDNFGTLKLALDAQIKEAKRQQVMQDTTERTTRLQSIVDCNRAANGDDGVCRVRFSFVVSATAISDITMDLPVAGGCRVEEAATEPKPVAILARDFRGALKIIEDFTGQSMCRIVGDDRHIRLIGQTAGRWVEVSLFDKEADLFVDGVKLQTTLSELGNEDWPADALTASDSQAPVADADDPAATDGSDDGMADAEDADNIIDFNSCDTVSSQPKDSPGPVMGT